MALRKGWDALSAPQRRRYERAGITEATYNAGVNLEAARRGVNVTKAPGREAAILKQKRAAEAPARKTERLEREKQQRAARTEQRRQQWQRLKAWSDEHGKTEATNINTPGILVGRPTNRQLQSKQVIEYLNAYDAYTGELTKGMYGVRQGSAGGDPAIINGFLARYKQGTTKDGSADKYLGRFYLL
jgi:hypothetical protein